MRNGYEHGPRALQLCQCALEGILPHALIDAVRSSHVVQRRVRVVREQPQRCLRVKGRRRGERCGVGNADGVKQRQAQAAALLRAE